MSSITVEYIAKHLNVRTMALITCNINALSGVKDNNLVHWEQVARRLHNMLYQYTSMKIEDFAAKLYVDGNPTLGWVMNAIVYYCYNCIFCK